ncbi:MULTISPECIES: siderophore-interacting protein [unclassified Undibacterium]|uniref:siderophore-interacting protein n=1 Tax=unclassified Undibacterium TaxID=2630295 RepID=UPI002AC99B24|nr:MULTISPECIES: siderophore-interacting protein [unclassified Undibacterium]MEB0138755.1 siderophore-interacting protein [Undibacterium sp. CCC2.1]MEB0171556.1 siderophore-interacting protein [Undibacterium sp. CCC1.1]MEB0175373.1 siderophore-interacting protein [Undibacterium sp. CCC3.4]MEB0214756.1 siderophore-interacting protein [Undibacterium sp. 5I2]WPX43286.1 siderophore-interacting protein [Undibacterium sp. CCC3.4]
MVVTKLNLNMHTSTKKPPINHIPLAAMEAHNAMLQAAPVRPQSAAIVTAREQLSAARIRLSFSGDDVATFIHNEATQAPGTWVKLFVPAANGEIIGRAYTLRQFDLSKGSFEIEFFTHQNGPASSWAHSAQIGDSISFAGPRAGGFSLHPASAWLALIGDETGWSAIQAILTTLPTDLPAIILIEVEHPDQHPPFLVGPNMQLHYIKRTHQQLGADQALVSSLDELEIPSGSGQAWVAGESSSVMAIRKFLQEKWKLDKTDLHTKGYWKQGESHFRS